MGWSAPPNPRILRGEFSTEKGPEKCGATSLSPPLCSASCLTNPNGEHTVDLGSASYLADGKSQKAEMRLRSAANVNPGRSQPQRGYHPEWPPGIKLCTWSCTAPQTLGHNNQHSGSSGWRCFVFGWERQQGGRVMRVDPDLMIVIAATVALFFAIVAAGVTALQH